MYEMHLIIYHQQALFTGLISFYKFFKDMHFTRVILLLRSNVGRYPQNKEWVPKNNLSIYDIKQGKFYTTTSILYQKKKHFWPLDEGGSIQTVQLVYALKKEKKKGVQVAYLTLFCLKACNKIEMLKLLEPRFNMGELM